MKDFRISRQIAKLSVTFVNGVTVWKPFNYKLDGVRFRPLIAIVRSQFV